MLLWGPGLVKKDPNAGGAAVPDKNAKHIPFCFFNVTWTVVAPGSIEMPPAASPKKAAAPAPAASTFEDLPDTTTPAVDTPAVAPITGRKTAVAPATATAKKAAAPAPAAAGPASDDFFGL